MKKVQHPFETKFNIRTDQRYITIDETWDDLLYVDDVMGRITNIRYMHGFIKASLNMVKHIDSNNRHYYFKRLECLTECAAEDLENKIQYVHKVMKDYEHRQDWYEGLRKESL